MHGQIASDIPRGDPVPSVGSSDGPLGCSMLGAPLMTRFSIRHAISPIIGFLMMAQTGTLNAAAPHADVLAMLSQDRAATVEGQSDAASSVSPTATVSPVVYGAAGSRRWFIGGIVGSDLGDEKMAFLSGGFEWFAIDDFSIGVEADLGWVGQDAGADAGLFGLTIMMRWHFLRYERWTVYGEIGAGLAYTSEPVRPTGGQLNFTPQVGVGFSMELEHQARLLVGLGWYHISNARTTTTNLGVDAVALTARISLPF